MDISRFSQCEILVVGDLMIDVYLKGEVERISPEAPVPVVAVQSEEHTLGGAGNVVNNLLALGAGVTAAGVVGAGPNGSFMIRKFHELGLTTEGVIRESGRPTTRKTRVLAGSQQVLRIDRETIRDISDRSHRAMIKAVEEILPRMDVMLISDYGKGGVTRELIVELAAMARERETPVIVDPKGLDFSRYNGVSMITPNKKEAGIAARI
ncbi:MAG: D-glycero-beta-D-manno-heptose-7-phosphate kinase, partial [Desulfobacterales bacterium]|nr:D-glycero-beta-D-manno-heptose-7-phosphate kinase [Desulfobacterales bacterium]